MSTLGDPPVFSLLLHVPDGLHETVAAISAVAANTTDGVEFETLILDDATTDGTAEFLAGLSGSIRFIRADQPVGYTAAIRQLMGLASAPLLVLLDHATLVQPGWVEPLLEAMEDPDVTGAQPVVLDRDGRVASAGIRFAEDGRPLLRFAGSPWPGLLAATSPVDGVDGSCAMVRREVLVAGGGLDGSLPPGPVQFAELSSRLGGRWLLAGRSRVTAGGPLDVDSGSSRLAGRGDHEAAAAGRVRSIALYQPAYHRSPENDRSWGPGFTEWINVVTAQPRFEGHHQPHLPGELGLYDLRLPQVRAEQAELARRFGIDAFCYYHYWFHGRRLLNEPFDQVRASGQPDLPFCLCWANEDWPANRDGRSGEVLVEQTYSPEDDVAHIRWLLDAFSDPRYVRVEGKPLFLVYRAAGLPDPPATTERWREEARRAGMGDLYLCRVESSSDERTDPRPLGFDASVEFQPDRDVLALQPWTTGPVQAAFDYDRMAAAMLNKPSAGWRRIPCTTPGWDNTAQAGQGAIVLTDSTPGTYRAWVETVAERELAGQPSSPMLFVNAWNQWGEGAHLEPCAKWGTAYLRAHMDATGSAPARRITAATGVCVAGMHRSGTSLTASWLERCGVPVHDGRVMEAGVGNVRGHFEDLDFLGINEQAVKRQRPGTDGWKVTDSRPCWLTGDLRGAARSLIERRNRRHATWAWKDPRSTLLLEAWGELIPDLRTLLLWRPCADVVDSLLRRASQTTDSVATGLTTDLAVRIWLAYNRRALEYRRLHPEHTILLPTATLVAAPEDVHALIRSRLDLELGYVPLGDLYDPDLMQSGASLDLGRLAADVAGVEAELSELSDVPVLAAPVGVTAG